MPLAETEYLDRARNNCSKVKWIIQTKTGSKDCTAYLLKLVKKKAIFLTLRVILSCHTSNFSKSSNSKHSIFGKENSVFWGENTQKYHNHPLVLTYQYSCHCDRFHMMPETQRIVQKCMIAAVWSFYACLLEAAMKNMLSVCQVMQFCYKTCFCIQCYE